jgi:hypothetical protein
MVGRFVEGIPGIFTEATSFIMMCAGRERKAIHDWIVGTVVLTTRTRSSPADCTGAYGLRRRINSQATW